MQHRRRCRSNEIASTERGTEVFPDVPETSTPSQEYNTSQPPALLRTTWEPPIMRSMRYSIAVLILGVLATVGRADVPPDPLRLVPNEADLFLKIQRPRKLIETALNLDAFKQLRELEAVQEVYDST